MLTTLLLFDFTPLQIQRQQLLQNLFVGQIILPATGGENGFIKFLVTDEFLLSASHSFSLCFILQENRLPVANILSATPDFGKVSEVFGFLKVA